VAWLKALPSVAIHAISGDYAAQQLVVVQREETMLPGEAFHEHRQQAPGSGHRQRLISLELREVGPVLQAQRVARVADHTRHGGLEGGGEPLRVQLRDEELRDLLGSVLVAVRAAVMPRRGSG